MIPFREVDSIQYVVCELSDIGEVFSRYDPPAVAVGLTAMEFEAFVRLFGPKAAALGLTIIARSADTGEMIGALLTEDAASPPPTGLDQLSRKFDPIFDILGQLPTDYWRGKAVYTGEGCVATPA